MFTVLVWLGIGTAILIALAGAPIGVTRQGGLLFTAAGLSALFTSARSALICALLVLCVCLVDIVAARGKPRIVRTAERLAARGVAAPLHITAEGRPGASVRIRQPRVPDIVLVRDDNTGYGVNNNNSYNSNNNEPEADGTLALTMLPARRGRHELPAPATRVLGPLRLGAWHHQRLGEPHELLVYPDLPAARQIADAVRRGKFRDAGLISKGPLGLGTEFELVRDYSSDDDIRQVNWRATERMGRPMSNQYRIEQDRDVLLVVDCGRLMSAPLPPPRPEAPVLTRLDAALDAVAAVAYVADEVGDRCGAVAFDGVVRKTVSPRRRGGDAVVEALFDLEPSTRDSDYEAAFRRVGAGKRAFVLVLTDLLDESAAAALVEAVPVLARRHAVVVASVADPELQAMVSTPPSSVADVYQASVALDVLAAKTSVAGRLRSVGAEVIEAEPAQLASACVATYLRAKSRARV